MLLSALTISMVNGYGFEDRICPTGYFNAGPDTPPDDPESLKSYWEVGRTPVYSCYKRIRDVNGINDGLDKCYTSVMDSDQMEARVVIFEDAIEVDRVFNWFDEHEWTEDGIEILTSAMSFKMDGNESEWIYLGTNYKNLSVTDVITDTNDGESTALEQKQCLTVTRHYQSDNNATTPPIPHYGWKAVNCVGNGYVDVLCEIRVETVTYAWIPNWLTITLVILTIVLLVTCCMAALSYKQYTPRPYRGSQQSPQVAAYPVDDAPPKYSEVTGVATNEDQGKFDKYKNKGKEILAKIYVVKDR